MEMIFKRAELTRFENSSTIPKVYSSRCRHRSGMQAFEHQVNYREHKQANGLTSFTSLFLSSHSLVFCDIFVRIWEIFSYQQISLRLHHTIGSYFIIVSILAFTTLQAIFTIHFTLQINEGISDWHFLVTSSILLCPFAVTMDIMTLGWHLK